jgi:hypothetical protein
LALLLLSHVSEVGDVTFRSVRGVTMGAFLCGIGLNAGCSSSSWPRSLTVSCTVKYSSATTDIADASTTAASLSASIATMPLEGMVNVGPNNTGRYYEECAECYTIYDTPPLANATAGWRNGDYSAVGSLAVVTGQALAWIQCCREIFVVWYMVHDT